MHRYLDTPMYNPPFNRSALRLLSCSDSLLNSSCCASRLLRSNDGLVGYDNVFELVLGNGVDGVCV
jgi:hypothetical protein